MRKLVKTLNLGYQVELIQNAFEKEHDKIYRNRQVFVSKNKLDELIVQVNKLEAKNNKSTNRKAFYNLDNKSLMSKAENF